MTNHLLTAACYLIAAPAFAAERPDADETSFDIVIQGGTVIDPDMTNSVRVTVVATGLGQPAGMQQAPIRVVPKDQPVIAAEPNYSMLDRPTVQRRAATSSTR